MIIRAKRFALLLKVPSVYSTTFPNIPVETSKAANALYGCNNLYMLIGDQLEDLFSGFTLDASLGNWRKAPRELALFYLITLFQYLEWLPDNRVLDAVHGRVDWQYALHLAADYPDLHLSPLCYFRQWLMGNPSGMKNLQVLLTSLQAKAQHPALADLENDPVPLITQVCTISRLATLWETISQTLEALAIKDHQWLRTISLSHWYTQYGYHRKALNLRQSPSEQQQFAQALGTDGAYLLKALSDSKNIELSKLPEIQTLIKVWDDQFTRVDGQLNWRAGACTYCPILAIDYFSTPNYLAFSA